MFRIGQKNNRTNKDNDGFGTENDMQFDTIWCCSTTGTTPPKIFQSWDFCSLELGETLGPDPNGCLVFPDTRLLSPTWKKMAALLRGCAARTCRLLASYNSRNPFIYKRTSPSFYREHVWKVCQPSLSGSRYLSNESSASEEDIGNRFQNQTEHARPVASPGVSIESDNQDLQGKRANPSQGGDLKYQRQIRQLGTLVMKSHLIRAFEEILERGRQYSAICSFDKQYYL